MVEMAFKTPCLAGYKKWYRVQNGRTFMKMFKAHLTISPVPCYKYCFHKLLYTYVYMNLLCILILVRNTSFCNPDLSAFKNKILYMKCVYARLSRSLALKNTANTDSKAWKMSIVDWSWMVKGTISLKRGQTALGWWKISFIVSYTLCSLKIHVTALVIMLPFQLLRRATSETFHFTTQTWTANCNLQSVYEPSSQKCALPSKLTSPPLH